MPNLQVQKFAMHFSASSDLQTFFGILRVLASLLSVMPCSNHIHALICF
uniref:Uncharacterized protein n=1 Tax=Rhizophora mucronata TaxID=61149 RepID=A0A2P2PDL1_RHIMU